MDEKPVLNPPDKPILAKRYLGGAGQAKGLGSMPLPWPCRNEQRRKQEVEAIKDYEVEPLAEKP